MENINYYLTTIALAIIAAVGKYVISYLGALTKDKVSQIENEQAQQFLLNAHEAVYAGVQFTWQTYVSEIKKKGSFDKGDQLSALRCAIQVTREQMTKDAKAYIEKNFGDIDRWIETQIEQAIDDLKNDRVVE